MSDEQQPALTPAAPTEKAGSAIYRAEFKDGLTSFTNSLANQRNAHNTNQITAQRVGREELRAIYRTGVGSKIIRLKTGIALDDTLQFDSTADEDFYNSRLRQIVKDASKFMLGFGRSLIVVHEPGADLTQPPKKISDWECVAFHVFSGDMVYVTSVNLDLSSQDYFKPRAYTVRGFQIHPSRVVDMNYVMPVEMDAPEYQFGGISEFELIRNELVSDQIVQRAVPSILEKSSTRYYKVDGFKDLLADHKENELLTYFQTLETLRSVYGAGIIDKEDEIETHDQALTNLAESDLVSLRRLAMVTGLPLSWLVGEAARGLNSTGEGERQVLMQTITNFQSDYLLSPINRLMRLCGRGKVEFKENQGETPNDRIDYEKKAVEVALILWQMGEDHSAYLIDKGVTKKDPFDSLFEIDEPEPAPELPEDGEPPGINLAEFMDANSVFGSTPKTLYVSRKVENASEILSWARKQGFSNLIPAEEMHVTVMYSRASVDWMAMGEAWNGEFIVLPGGPREALAFGQDGKSGVVAFSCSELAWRHESMKERGATWDWDNYQPHITVSSDIGDLDLSGVEPYMGRIVLGPEIFQPIERPGNANEA